MATIEAINKPRPKTWTVADLYRRFGPIPFERIRHDPPPGSGTVDDVVRLSDHEHRLYELVDGILVESNTPKEMDEKLHEYFEKGVRLVWFVRPKSRVVDVYAAPDRFTRLTASAQLDGGDVLPGFSVQVSKLFQKPKAPGGGNGKKKKNGRQRGR
jgi:Uma2 family endonuclease